MPPSCLIPCLGAVRGAWPLPSPSDVSHAALGPRVWPTQCGRSSALWASERWPGGKRSKSGQLPGSGCHVEGSAGGPGGPATEHVFACGVCMKNTGQTSSPSGGHSNNIFWVRSSPSTLVKIATSHWYTHASASAVFFSLACIIIFFSSFLIWIPFISFSCVIALARASSIMLNRSGENDHSCLFLMLEEKFSAFHL